MAERIAVRIEGTGCTVPEAEAHALAEAGFASWAEFAAAHADAIRAALPAPTLTTAKLVRITRAFLETPWFDRAVRLGYSADELFGVDEFAPSNRVDAWGLVSGLALSVLNGPKLTALDAAGVAITLKSGATLRWNRGAPGLDRALVWWRVPALVDVKTREAA
jgi:hypothetical protein